ncbi:ileal sodium/bile acid cotransporter-like [Glandiceps talaboti]
MSTTLTVPMGNASNMTGPAMWTPDLKLVIISQIDINVTLILMMIAMGCAMTVSDIKEILRRPVAVTLGALCQFGVMPTLGFSLAHLFQLPPNMAVGTIIIASCPGGLLSNFYAFWTEGDPTLSVCMTTVSTILGIGMMPLCIYLYSQSWATLTTTLIPSTRDIIISLVVLLVPVAFGMFIRWKWPKPAEKIGLVINIFVVLGVLSTMTLYIVAFTPIFQSSWRPYLVAFTYPVLSYIFGYCIAWIFKRNKYQCRTIAFETGVQNGALALSLINLLVIQGKGAGPGIGQMMIVPILHTLAVVVEGFGVIILYWCYKRLHLGEKRLAVLDTGRDLQRLRGDKSNIPAANSKSSESVSAAAAGGNINKAYYNDSSKPYMVDEYAQTSFPDENNRFVYSSTVLTPRK